MRTGRSRFVIFGFAMAIGAIVGCPRPSAETSGGAPLASSAPPAPAAECAKDSDCVPAVCCHADKCVPRSQAPACGGIMCTHMCMPGTIDCGGGCGCQTGRCSARLMGNP